ncbi:MAG: DUF1264 domain-containing protein [Nitrososphaeraceae archaeon]|nr:DUF1264 domain-containing protein [Nitrososphaeraceae archaeon]
MIEKINLAMIITISLLFLGITGMVNTFAQTDTNNNTKILYNPDLNPRQVEYPAILGFNDLHIEAINHLNPNMTSSSNANEDVRDIIVHHHCKLYDDMSAACLLFPTGMNDQDKPYGMEYVITSEQYKELPQDEKKYWHYHLTELPKVNATLPDLTSEEALTLKPILDETYGKIVYFWQYGDKYPIGEPQVVIIEDITG